MKIDRLLGIITILLQCERITAPELAERFEVSRRTINRDVEDICKAGIPIVTYQGGNGGISIADGYKLDKSVLSVDELQSIITGLKSLGSVTNTAAIQGLIQKLSPKSEAVASLRDSILIDLSSHYKSSLSEKINLIKSAVSVNKLICFDYFSDKGVSHRRIEPYFITFKWSAWYIFGYCTQNKGFRLFKLNRLWNCKIEDGTFIPRELLPDEIEPDNYFNDKERITILFDKSVEYRLVEEYGPDCYEVLKDGKLKLNIGYTSRDYIISWILGFGDKARVVEPAELEMEIMQQAKNILRNYEHDM